MRILMGENDLHFRFYSFTLTLFSHLVGLDAAGKTTILYKLKLGEIVTTIPTIGNGFSVFKNPMYFFSTREEYI